MDPEQLQIILGYALFVGVASLLLRYREPQLSRFRIAFITGGVLPLLGVGVGALAFWRWVDAAPLPNDTDHNAMGVIGILILLFLSLACLIVGMITSLLVTMIVPRR